MTSPRFLPAALLALALLLSALVGQRPAVPMPQTAEQESPLGPRSRIAGERPIPQLEEGLLLRDNRVLYRSVRSLREHYPYLVAATTAEFAKRMGIELRWANLHSLFQPIPSEAAAVELVRTMEGGEIVPDRAAYDRLVDAAGNNPMPAGSWKVEVHPRVPERFGLAAERTADGFAVRGTIFTTSGYGALDVVEIHARFPAAGPYSIETFPAISGPPQSWQTSGDVDQEAQRKLYRAVAGFRAALLDALRKELTLEAVAEAYTSVATFAMVRRRIGEPLRDIGSGRHIYVYRLGDGRAVSFAVTQDDTPVASAALHEGYDLDAGLGKLIEELRPRPIRAGKQRKE